MKRKICETFFYLGVIIEIPITVFFGMYGSFHHTFAVIPVMALCVLFGFALTIVASLGDQLW